MVGALWLDDSVPRDKSASSIGPKWTIHAMAWAITNMVSEPNSCNMMVGQSSDDQVLKGVICNAYDGGQVDEGGTKRRTRRLLGW